MKTEFKNLVIEISGSRKIIWEALTDFDNYFNWNTVVPYGRGALKTGNNLLVSVKLPGKKAELGKCHVNEVVPQKHFVLSRKMVFKWLLYMEHAFIIGAVNESADQFTFVQTLKVSGVLKPLLKHRLRLTWEHFNQMNLDLRNQIIKIQNHGTTTGLEENPQVL